MSPKKPYIKIIITAVVIFIFLGLGFVAIYIDYSYKVFPGEMPAKYDNTIISDILAKKAKNEQGLINSRPETINYGFLMVLDLNGNGIIDTVGLADGVYFDHDGNRFAERTAWAGAGDAVLFWDRNENGRVDEGGEFFGNQTLLSDGRKAANGFEALAELDSNGDGVIDQYDESWSNLYVRVVAGGKLPTLEEVGVAGLNLGYVDSNHTDENGNQHRQTGSFIRADGTTGQMTYVGFKISLADTKFLDEVEVPADIKRLPDIRGYGNIPRLHQVMAREENGVLRGLVERFLASDPLTAKTMTWDIIFAWAGVTDLDPASRGPNMADARKLYAMEKYWGKKWYSLLSRGGSDPNPHAKDATTVLKKSFEDFEQQVTAYLMFSTHYDHFYTLASRAAKAIEAGATNQEALDYLITVFKVYFYYGTETDRAEISDFLSMLRVYDPRGRACLEALWQFYTTPFEKRATDKP